MMQMLELMVEMELTIKMEIMVKTVPQLVQLVTVQELVFEVKEAVPLINQEIPKEQVQNLDKNQQLLLELKTVKTKRKKDQLIQVLVQELPTILMSLIS